MVEDLSEMIGSTLLVGITYVGADGEVDNVVQFAGIVRSVEPLVVIERPGKDDFTLPPEPDAYDLAGPGDYRLRSTGQVVEDPDYVTVWTVEAPDE